MLSPPRGVVRPMTATPNVISLDVGSRRIGVALANLEARMAAPLMTIDRVQVSDIFPVLIELFEKHGAVAVVVGLPRGMEGQETDQTASARQFAAELGKQINIPIHLQDEAATSIEAEEELKANKKPYQKGDIDKLAAAIILRDWLAGQVQEVKS